MTRSVALLLGSPFLAVFAAPLSAAAQSVKLNLPLPLNPGRNGGSVSLFVLSPDATRLVYLAREGGDARAELRSLPLDGTAPTTVKLTGAISPREDLLQQTLRFTADGSELVFTTQEAAEEEPTYRIYRVPVTGGARPTLVTLSETTEFTLAGEWVVFETLDESWNTELRSVPLDGHVGAVLLAENAELAATTSERVISRQLSATSLTWQLFSVRPDGTGSTRIDGPLGERGRVYEAQVTTDKTRVVYRADQRTVGQTEVFCAPIDGSGAGVPISGALGTQRVTDLLAVSPDSTRALYLLPPGSREELYSAPLDGSAAPVKLNDPLGSNDRIASASFTADGLRVVYRTDAQSFGKNKLFSVPSDGSGPVVLLTPVSSLGTISSEIYVVAAGRVLYLAVAANGVTDLYSVPVDGSAAPVRLSQLSNLFSDVNRFVVSKEGGQVAFFADVEVDERFDLYSVPTSGSVAPVRINPTGVATDAFLTPDGTQVLYTLALPLSNQRDLLRRPANASAPPVQVNGLLSQGDVQGNVTTFGMDAGGERVVYSADQQQDTFEDLISVDLRGRPEHAFLSDPSPIPGAIHTFRLAGSRCLHVQAPGPGHEGKLFSVPLDRSLVPVRLSSSSGNAGFYQPTGDGLGVVFVDRVDDRRQLYAAPIDGSSSAVLLSGSLVQGRDVDAFTTTPDSARALYLADATLNDRLEIYSTPLDGSVPPIAISGALVAGGEVLQWHAYDAPLVTPDSRFAVYRADAFVNDRAELFSAPVGGGEPPRRLSGTAIVAGGDVQGPFALTADGTRVVFRADLFEDERFELFSAPVDGSAPPVRLNGALVEHGDLTEFELTPDGTRVLYLADERKDERSELFVTSVAGDERARLLSAPLVDGGDVLNLEIDPRGSFAVYLADQAIDEEWELYHVPLDGTGAPRRLNAPLVRGGLVAHDFRITPDSRGVVYLAEQDVDDQFELYHASVAPRGGVTKLSGPLTAGGDVQYFQVGPDGRRVVYMANQDDVNVMELYLSRRLPGVRAVR